MFENMGETWAESAGEIVIMLLIAFALGYLVKVFSGKEKEIIEDLESQLDAQNSMVNSLNKRLKREEHKYDLLNEENARLQNFSGGSSDHDTNPTLPEQE